MPVGLSSKHAISVPAVAAVHAQMPLEGTHCPGPSIVSSQEKPSGQGALASQGWPQRRAPVAVSRHWVPGRRIAQSSFSVQGRQSTFTSGTHAPSPAR